jgi:methylthioribulose-1-phosphate dehydratase
MNKDDLAKYLSECGAEFYRRGWVMGTAGNFSALIGREPLNICITASGNEKGGLGNHNFLEVNGAGQVTAGAGKPSAETLIHTAIYKLRPEAGSILHTHSVWGTILSDAYFPHGAIEIQGYEMEKGLAGVTTHEHLERVPIVENSQNYQVLAGEIEDVLDRDLFAHGIYLRRHGLYTWGKDIAEAKRHIEIFEFLFEVLGRRL